MTSRFSLRDHFERLRESLELDCTACGLCVEACPIFGRGVLEDANAVEIAEARVAMASDGTFSEAAYVFARACLRCGGCRDVCPEDLDSAQANHLVRLAAAAGDPAAVERYAADTAGLRTLLPTSPANPFRMLQVLQMGADDISWHTTIPDDPPQVDVLLFLSCVGMARVDRIRTLLELMELTGVRFATIGGLDFCCGLLDALAGDLDTAQRHFDRLAEAVAAFGARELVTDCPSCYGWFSDLARTAPLPFAYRHTTQLLSDHVDELPPRRPVEVRVTVHDPCHYGRQPDEWGPSRALVAAVPGLELVEMPRARGETACCGGPATGYQPDLGRALAAERAREAAAVGAEAILTPCPGCIASLEEAARAEGLLADDVVGPLARALGIEHASPLPSLLSGGTVDDALERAAGNLWERTHPREEVERFVAALLVRGRAR